MNSISFNSVPVARLSLFGYEYVLWTLCCRETLNNTSPSLLNSSTITAIFINIILDSFFNQPVNSAFILFQSPVLSYSIIICFMDALLFHILNYNSSSLSFTCSCSFLPCEVLCQFHLLHRSFYPLEDQPYACPCLYLPLCPGRRLPAREPQSRRRRDRRRHRHCCRHRGLHLCRHR